MKDRDSSAWLIAILIAAFNQGSYGDEALDAIRANMPRVVLNQVVYEDGESASANVTFVKASDADDAIAGIVFAGESSGDVETVTVMPTSDPLVFETDPEVKIGEDSGSPTAQDGVLEISPNEIFTALLSYKLSSRTQSPGEQAFSADWGILFDPDFSNALVDVKVGMALTDDELNPPAGLRPIGTLFVEGGVGPVQVGAEELLFMPESDAQLAEFLARTGGVVTGYEGALEGSNIDDLPDAGTAWLRVKLNGNPAKIANLPQLRALLGESEKLSASNEATLALVGTALELWAEGFLVGLNPRLQLHAPLSWPEHLLELSGGPERIDSYGQYPSATGDHNAQAIKNSNFGIRQSWAFMAMFDYDRFSIPVGVVDSGFAPNPDFKITSSLYRETNMSNGTTGIGSARVPQEVGNSFFGGKSWHGNGTVTTIAGVGGNFFGTAGTGAQTAVPMLYHMGLANFAVGFGTAIRRAVDDGASVVNISAGYPCRILSVLGNDDICAREGRAAFTVKLGLAIRAAALAACAAGGVIDAFIPGLGTVICATAVGAAETAAMVSFSALFVGETRGPVERGVAYATAAGVPIVASAGNRFSEAALGPLGPLVNVANYDIDDWQVIPAVIPEVIAVGACAPHDSDVWNGSGWNFYANLHFHGDSVDIWSPIGTFQWAPDPTDVDPSTISTSDHIRREFGGTSNAAPFITGIIANLMAINPNLDRRFASAAQRPLIPGLIRSLLVDTAHQAGDPTAPASSAGLTVVEWNPVTEMHEPIDCPPELADNLSRRRNYVNAWAAIRQAASDVGVLDYEALGYTADLGRDDQISDISAPDGLRSPNFINAFTYAEEISEGDRDFWWTRMPGASNLYQIRYEMTIPLHEMPNTLLINRRPGTVTSSTADEQKLTWITRRLWQNQWIATEIRGQGPADTVYRLETSLVTFPLPPADIFDIGFNSNETLDDAALVDDWVNVTPEQLLEVDAWEICQESLNFHEAEDVDVFEIPFPSALGVPSSCGGFDPWVTVSIDPPDGSVQLTVLSRSGGSDRVLASGNGSLSIRIDCADYRGRLPLFVKVESVSSGFAEYALKVHWSIPDEETGDRLERIREAWAVRELIPAFEQFFRPQIPWLRISPGFLPQTLVNPNPEFAQELNASGQFEASRLFLVNVPDTDPNVRFDAVIPGGQSLRMELVGLDEQVIGITSTPDLGNAGQLNIGDPPEPISQTLVLTPSDVPAGVYILRLSGHRPGDEIALYLGKDLVPAGTLSAEALDPQGQANGEPTLLSPLTGFDSAFLVSTPVFPAVSPGDFCMEDARALTFTADSKEGYRVEILGSDGIWEPFGSPIYHESQQTLALYVPCPYAGALVQIAKLNGGGEFPGDINKPALRLLFQSVPGIPYELMGNTTLGESGWSGFGQEPSFMGTGHFFDWFVEADSFTQSAYFFQVQW